MKDLQMLVQLLSGVKVSKLNIIGTEGESGTKVQQLYDGILEGEITDDVEGAQRFYPDGAYSVKYFGKLKRKLQDRLLNTLFFIDVDTPQFTEYNKANQICHRNLLIVKLLLSYRQRHLAMIIARKTFKKAIRFDFIEVALMLARELRIHYGSITGETDKAEFFNKYIEKFLKTYASELKAEKYYSKLMSFYVFSSANKPEALEMAEEFCDNLRSLFGEVDSFRFRYISYLVYILRYEAENDYGNTLKVCQEALTYFATKKHIIVKTVLFQFYFKMISCHLQLHQYEKAKESIFTCLDLVPEGDYNWYVTQELHFLLLVRSQDFPGAFKVYSSVFAQSNFSSQYQPVLERWKINEAFVHFLMLKGRIEQVKDGVSKKFRINKFLNEVPKHSKDKRGTNITILILQILFLLEQERHGEIFERIEPLRMYSSRYLRKDGTFRGNCFIKMLMQLPAGHFHKEAVKRKATPYLKKLESMPLDIANQAAELEIIPYEELWEYVMESLDNKVR
ncbi:MAG: hypothetical protein DWQ02_18990 [Bacteroidetes bacterium]|nr:MAG: hypothetical protein DWQ02_18990 [Bacteroidota bacterium]